MFCFREAAVVYGNKHSSWSQEIWDGIFPPAAYSLCSPWASYYPKKGNNEQVIIQKEVTVTTVIAL